MTLQTITHLNRLFVVESSRELPGFGWQLFTRDSENGLPRLFVVKADGTIIA